MQWRPVPLADVEPARVPTTLAIRDTERIRWSCGLRVVAWVMAILRGVEPYEVMQALLAGRRWPRPVIGPEGVSLVMVWARTQAGRPLVVVIRHEGGLDWWIVGAREMSPAEVAEYKGWEGER
jgi:hypothetical protein